MEGQGTQGSLDQSLTPVSQDMVVSQDQKRVTDYFPAKKKRNRRGKEKARGDRKGGADEGLASRLGAAAGCNTSSSPTEEIAKVAVLPADPEDSWEEELLQLDLDRGFYSAEGRPWKAPPNGASWHASPDLEGLSREALESTFGKNPRGRARHSIDLQNEDGIVFAVRWGDCVRIRSETSEGGAGAETLVCVDGLISVDPARGEAKRVVGTSGEAGLVAVKSNFWIKGRKLLTLAETILKPAERPAGGDATADWPAQERFLGTHTTALWHADQVTKTVAVVWGVRAPGPPAGSPVSGRGTSEGSTGAQTPAGDGVIYVPFKYCSETHDFVALEKSPDSELPLSTSAVSSALRQLPSLTPPIELEGTKQTPVAAHLPAPQSPALSAFDPRPALPSRPSESPPSPAKPFIEPLRLTFGSWQQETPEALPSQIPPSPIILINAAALPPAKREAALRSPRLVAQPRLLPLDRFPNQSSKRVTDPQPEAETAGPATSGTPLHLPSPPSDCTPPQLPAAQTAPLALPLTAPPSKPPPEIPPAQRPPPESVPFQEPLRLAPSKPKRLPGVLHNLDLCAGTGALGLGCSFGSIGGGPGAPEIVPKIAVDIDKNALSTCNKNIPGMQICKESMHEFCERILSGKDPTAPGPRDVDMITAGLPCQSFSGANPLNATTSIRRKSASLGPETQPPIELSLKELPPGRMLFKDFLRIVEYLQPRFIVVEEVIEFLTLLDSRLNEPACVALTRALVRLGYQTRWQILLAALFGAPQNRYRVFLCAARLGEKLPQVAVPTHRAFGRPTAKSLGEFPRSFLQLCDPSADGPKPAAGKKPKRKKARMGVQIVIRAPKIAAPAGDKAAAAAGGPVGAVPKSTPEAALRQADRLPSETEGSGPEASPEAASSGIEKGPVGNDETPKDGAGLSGAAEPNHSGAPGNARGGVAGGSLRGQLSGALKRKRNEDIMPEPVPDPAAFFRTREGYAVVNKRPPNLAGAEGDRQRVECSCCLQRQRASETADLLPAVTVHQAIGHLPDKMTSEVVKSWPELFNHQGHGVNPGLSKKAAQMKLLKPGQKDADLPKEFRSHGARDRGKKPTKAIGGTKGRITRDGQAPTAMCTVNDTNSACIHYAYDRFITPREQASLQTFPENFKFMAHENEKKQIASWYRQIGNAVPMVVGAALGRSILATLS